MECALQLLPRARSAGHRRVRTYLGGSGLGFLHVLLHLVPDAERLDHNARSLTAVSKGTVINTTNHGQLIGRCQSRKNIYLCVKVVFDTRYIVYCFPAPSLHDVQLFRALSMDRSVHSISVS